MSGRALVVVTTVGFPDREGDLVMPNALVNSTAVVSDKDHSVVMNGTEPVGEAYLEERGGRIWARVRYYDDP